MAKFEIRWPGVLSFLLAYHHNNIININVEDYRSTGVHKLHGNAIHDDNANTAY